MFQNYFYFLPNFPNVARCGCWCGVLPDSGCLSLSSSPPLSQTGPQYLHIIAPWEPRQTLPACSLEAFSRLPDGSRRPLWTLKVNRRDTWFNMSRSLSTDQPKRPKIVHLVPLTFSWCNVLLPSPQKPGMVMHRLWVVTKQPFLDDDQWP